MVAAKGPVAVKMAKHLVQRGQDLDLANANAMEADVFGFLCATEDKHEGHGGVPRQARAEVQGPLTARRSRRRAPIANRGQASAPRPGPQWWPCPGSFGRVVTYTVPVKLGSSVPSARWTSIR